MRAFLSRHPCPRDRTPWAPTGLVALIREFLRHPTQEGTVASFPILPSPGVTQKRLITHSIVLAHTGPHCSPLAQRGSPDNGLEWHLALLSPMLHLCVCVWFFFSLQSWIWLNNDFLQGVSAFHLHHLFLRHSSGPGSEEAVGSQAIGYRGAGPVEMSPSQEAGRPGTSPLPCKVGSALEERTRPGNTGERLRAAGEKGAWRWC